MPPAFSILFEDNHLLVIDKPAGLPAQGGDHGHDHVVLAAERYLRERYHKPGNVFVGLVHRLDRNTSGVMALARTSKAAARLTDSFRTGACEKRYVAWVAPGHQDLPPSGHLEHWLAPTPDHGTRVVPKTARDAQRAALTFTVLARTPELALVAVTLETGRKHQIRVQFSAAGWPLWGDHRYSPPALAARLPRLGLHAHALSVPHPIGGALMRWTAPIPPDLATASRAAGLTLPPTLLARDASEPGVA